ANRFMPSVDRLVPLRLLCRLPFLFQLLLSLVAVIAQLKAAAQDLPVSLFLEGASTTPQAEAERSPFSRARLLQVDPRATAALLSLTPDQPARILLNLFGDEQHPAVLDRCARPEPGRAICRGTVEGQPGSVVILALSGGALAGSVFIPGHGNFQIQAATNG